MPVVHAILLLTTSPLQTLFSTVEAALPNNCDTEEFEGESHVCEHRHAPHTRKTDPKRQILKVVKRIAEFGKALGALSSKN